MNKFIPFVLLLLIFSCSKNNKETIKTKIALNTEIIENKGLLIKDELYDLQFNIETTENNKHNLIININLFKGAEFISPFEKKQFKGKFYMDLGSYNDLSFEGKIIETPRAVSRYDGFKNEQVIWVKENTSYKQVLNIKTKNDFEVFGRVRFTIEPRCSLEEIPFSIIYKDGKMTLKNPKC